MKTTDDDRMKLLKNAINVWDNRPDDHDELKLDASEVAAIRWAIDKIEALEEDYSRETWERRSGE